MTDEELIVKARRSINALALELPSAVWKDVALTFGVLANRLIMANADAELLASRVERVPKAWQFVEDADALIAHEIRTRGDYEGPEWWLGTDQPVT